MSERPLKMILLGVFYFSHHYIFSAICEIYNLPMTFNYYFFPFLIIILFSFSTQLSYRISLSIYSITYVLATTYLSLMVNVLMFILIHSLIKIFFLPPMVFSTLFCIIFPFALSIFGLISARLIFLDRILLKTKHNIKSTTIAHLTDVHLGAIYQTGFTEKIVDIINTKINPDIVIITGDLFDSNLQPQLNWIKPFEKVKVPILYVTGNHEEIIDKNVVINLIKKTNIIPIGDCKGENQYEINGINFIGVDYDFDMIKYLHKEKLPKDKVNVLIGHVPAMRPEELEKFDVFLFLCGHTHAGQMFPIHIVDYLINKCFKGLYEEKGRYIYVSHGTGTSLFPMRIGSFNSIGVITIQKQ